MRKVLRDICCYFHPTVECFLNKERYIVEVSFIVGRRSCIDATNLCGCSPMFDKILFETCCWKRLPGLVIVLKSFC